MIPNNNFLYQIMIFRDWSVSFGDNFMKMPQLKMWLVMFGTDKHAYFSLSCVA